MNIFWLEETDADVPSENDWLTPSEVLRVNAMRFAKRRSDWRLGRWTAKLALATYLQWPRSHDCLANLEIRSAPSGAPLALVEGMVGKLTLSISHRAGVAICAIAPWATPLGCDLEIAEPRCDAFVSDYFSVEEQHDIARAPIEDRSWLIALLWSAKESALKALQQGLRLDTRCVSVTLAELTSSGRECEFGSGETVVSGCVAPTSRDSWHQLHVRCLHGESFTGFWQHTGEFIRTVVASPSPQSPIYLSRRWLSSETE